MNVHLLAVNSTFLLHQDLFKTNKYILDFRHICYSIFFSHKLITLVKIL